MNFEIKKKTIGYREPFTPKSQATITLLYIAYFWIFGSALAHVWAWQYHHQGISSYGVFAYLWALTTIGLGAIIIACFIVLALKDEEKE